MDQPTPPVSEDWHACQLLKLRADGVLIGILNGAEQPLEIAGIELPGPTPALSEFLDRLSRLRKPLRCRILSYTAQGHALAEIHYFGWQDKSGDVWIDLAATLIEQGFARPAKVS